MKEMTGWTLSEMAQELGVPQRTIERRVQRAGIKPLTHEAIYPPETLGIVKNRNKVGRPPKAKKE
jgi:predicted DNA-binding transcriptional regulator YafY